VQVRERDFDDVGEDLTCFAISGSAEAKFSALRASSHGLWEGVEAVWGEGGEGVDLEEMFIVDGDAAWVVRSLSGGVEEVVHGSVSGLFHSALETVLLVEVFMNNSSVDILAWGPVVLA
jgi:hypothetical protein